MKLTRYIPPWLWIVLIVLYVLSPVDLLPDMFGLPGRLDDLLVALLGAAYYLSYRSRARNRPGGSAGTGRGREGGSGSTEGGTGKERKGSTPGQRKDPYVILGVKQDAPIADVKRQYKERLLEYHPDRVQHLGPEIRELAEQRTKEINEAYRAVLQQRGEKG